MDVITELLISKTVNHEEIVHTVHVMFYLLLLIPDISDISATKCPYKNG